LAFHFTGGHRPVRLTQQGLSVGYRRFRFDFSATSITSQQVGSKLNSPNVLPMVEPENPFASPAIEPESATVWQHGPVHSIDRFLNFLVDGVMCFVPFNVIRFILFDFILPPAPGIGRDEWYLFWLFMAWFAASFLYYFALESMTGCTVGKQLTSTRVVDSRGTHPSVGQIAIRSLARSIPLDPLTYLVGQQAQGLHDWASGTRLVRFQRKTNPKAAVTADEGFREPEEKTEVLAR